MEADDVNTNANQIYDSKGFINSSNLVGKRIKVSQLAIPKLKPYQNYDYFRN
jgi:hypothetical protein